MPDCFIPITPQQFSITVLYFFFKECHIVHFICLMLWNILRNKHNHKVQYKLLYREDFPMSEDLKLQCYLWLFTRHWHWRHHKKFDINDYLHKRSLNQWLHPFSFLNLFMSTVCHTCSGVCCYYRKITRSKECININLVTGTAVRDAVIENEHLLTNQNWAFNSIVV